MKPGKTLCTSCRHLTAAVGASAFGCALRRTLITPSTPNLCHGHQPVRPILSNVPQLDQLNLFGAADKEARERQSAAP